MRTCEHCEASLEFRAKNSRPAKYPGEPWPMAVGRWPTWPPAEIAGCPCRCHEAWKITNRYPL